jgi:hypothetical protein
MKKIFFLFQTYVINCGIIKPNQYLLTKTIVYEKILLSAMQ